MLSKRALLVTLLLSVGCASGRYTRVGDAAAEEGGLVRRLRGL